MTPILHTRRAAALTLPLDEHPSERNDVAPDPSQPTTRTVVIVPTYNEVENLRPLAEKLLASPASVDVLCVDDASPDGTGALADEIAAAEPRFHVIHRTQDRGYAASSREGLSWALERGYDVTCTMDGDLSHDPAVLPAMLALSADGADLVIGSRYVDGGGVEVELGPDAPRGQRDGQRLRARDDRDAGATTARAATGATAPRHSRRSTSTTCTSDGYSFLIEVLAAAGQAGARIARSRSPTSTGSTGSRRSRAHRPRGAARDHGARDRRLFGSSSGYDRTPADGYLSSRAQSSSMRTMSSSPRYSPTCTSMTCSITLPRFSSRCTRADRDEDALVGVHLDASRRRG